MYAYNKSKNDVKERIKKIYNILNQNGKIILSLRSSEDGFNNNYEKNEKGLVINPFYRDNLSYVFHSQGDVCELMSECGFLIDYMEKFTRNHNMN